VNNKLTEGNINITIEDTTLFQKLFDKETTLSLSTKEKLIIFFYCILAIGLSVFQLYTAYNGLLEAWRQRSIFLMFILFMAFGKPRVRENGQRKEYYLLWHDYLLLGCTLVVSVYMYIDYWNIILRAGRPAFNDYVATVILVPLILIAVRRYIGWPLVLVTLSFFFYLYTGPYFPRALSHPGFTFGRIVDVLFNTSAGIFGIPLGVATTFIIIFIIFGAFLIHAGIGEYFIQFSYAMVGHMRGGPAKTAVIASALLGTVHGSGPGNVATTGSFTIPLMKSVGYSSVFAGAIEAAASTGGILLPPVMGAAAFLIAEYVGVSYYEIIKYAALPAILYFLGVYASLEIRTIKENIQPLQSFSFTEAKRVLKQLYLLIPLPLLIYFLSTGISPMRSAFFAIIVVFLISFINKSHRMGGWKIIKALEQGATSSLTVALSCATGGIIVGIASITGIGLKIARVVALSSNDLIALLIAMVACMILGLGMPVTPAYVVIASLTVPTLRGLGIEPIVGHLFIFYYAALGAITPPVGLSFYTAASISGGDYMKTGLAGFKLALAGFLVPFMFVQNDAILFMQGAGPALLAFLSAAFGIIILAIGVQGWFLGDLNVIERTLFIFAAVLLIGFGIYTDLAGLALSVSVCVYRYIIFKRKKGDISP